jgi:Domain of unknown function (DUF6134)
MKNIHAILISIMFVGSCTLYGQRGSVSGAVTPASANIGAAVAAGHRFRIAMGDNNIGWYKADVARGTETTEYTASSETSVRLLGKHTITFSLKCAFKDDMLISSEVLSRKNGKLRDHTTISWSGSAYQIVKNGDKSTVKDPIRNCNIQLYFEEPQDNMTTFSEKEAIYKKIKKMGENKYVLAELGEDSGNTFVYSNHELQRVNVSFILGDFSIIRN